MQASGEEVVTGLFEIHVFVLPLDPPPEVVQAFRAACGGHMKALLLNLDYVGKGFVGVLQTSRYVKGDVASARAAAAADAAVLRAAGLEVVRGEVEAGATCEGVARDARGAGRSPPPRRGGPGVARERGGGPATGGGAPRHAADAERSPPDRYFETHVLIDRPAGVIDDADVASLRDIAAGLSRRLATPVPLSYNALKPGQRFLNFRARGVGLDVVADRLRALEAAVANIDGLVVKKVIAGDICFDSNRAVDDGWLEPLP